MYFVAWNGEKWSSPFQPNELKGDARGGVVDVDGFSIAWDSDGYRGENWIALSEWTDEKAQKIMARDLSGR